MDIDEVADELYEAAPEEFIGLRTARQDEAKAEGDKALAKLIAALPKPSTAAWVCNLLVRAHREEIEGLVELGDLLRDAQQNLAGDQLRALNTQRGQLLNALTRQAAALARERGHRIGTNISAQVEETLRAAMADPEAGEALLTGRLTSPMNYSGMGTTGRPDLRLVPPPKPEKRPAAAPAPKAKKVPSTDRESAAARREREREEQRRAAEEKHRRDLSRAQEAADDARAAAEEARSAAEEQRREAEALAVEHADLQARVEDLADQLADAERHAAEAAAALKRAQRRSSAAEHEAAEAAEARDRAVGHLEQLQASGPG